MKLRHTEWYRSGYNGPDSKSGVPATVPWVRIPPTPPNIGSPHQGAADILCGWDEKFMPVRVNPTHSAKHRQSPSGGAADVLCGWDEKFMPVRVNPTHSAMSEQALYRLLRLFCKSQSALMPLLLLFAKSLARLTGSVVNALAAARCRYLLFASSSFYNFCAYTSKPLGNIGSSHQRRCFPHSVLQIHFW